MKQKSYVEFSTLYNSDLYADICAQIERGEFTAEFCKQETKTPWLDNSAVLSGKIGQTNWELSLILNPYDGCTSLGIDSDTATPYVYTAAGKTFELLPQDDYDGCRVINTDMLGNGGGTFGAYLLDLIEDWQNSLDEN